jgi:ATP-dependent Clp protease ATP-binding subunit ClpC
MSKDSYYINLSANAKKVISLDLNLLIAETKCRGEFEQWLKHIIKEIQITKTYILLIDEVHTLIGQVLQKSIDRPISLSQPLARRNSMIGTATSAEYRKYI